VGSRNDGHAAPAGRAPWGRGGGCSRSGPQRWRRRRGEGTASCGSGVSDT
jgi:hypothetical protein